MALTKVTGGVVSPSSDYAINNVTGVAATFTGNVSIGGTLTYQDVSNIDAIGIITARSAVSIADSIVHTGNTDTSIRFPADDTFAVEIAGSEKLRIDSSGHMGLGVTPNANWPTNGDFKALQIGTGIAVFGRGSGDQDRGGISANLYCDGSNYKYIANGNAGRIYFEDGSIVFNTCDSGTAGNNATLNQRLRIAAGGMITLGNPSNTTLKAEINNSVGGHYFVSQCNDNQNGFEIYQQHGATHTRAPFAVYDNKTGSKDLSFKIDGAGWTYYNTTSNGTTNGNIDKRYNWGSTNNLNFGMHLTTRQRYSIWEHRQIGRSQPRAAQMSCGENPSNQGTVIMYSSTANADVTGGVNLTNGATSWSSNSDMRLKNKTGDILNALEDINKIEPIKFTWKYGPDNNPHVGVSAQSVENVVPEAIERAVDVERKREGDETEYMQVRYTELIPLSIAAIKELKSEVESLKAEIASLKSS